MEEGSIMAIRMNWEKMTDREILVHLADKMNQTCSIVTDHENRIRGNERWKWKLMGIAGLIAFAVTVAGIFVKG